MALRVFEIHQLPPIQLGILTGGRFFAPLRVVRPEIFTDVRKFEPNVDEDRIAMTGRNQLLQVFVLCGIGFHSVPTRYMEDAHARGAPTLCEIVNVRTNAISGIEERPQRGGLDWQFEA